MADISTDSVNCLSIICETVSSARERDGTISSHPSHVSPSECKWLHLIMFGVVNVLCIYEIPMSTETANGFRDSFLNNFPFKKRISLIKTYWLPLSDFL